MKIVIIIFVLINVLFANRMCVMLSIYSIFPYVLGIYSVSSNKQTNKQTNKQANKD